MRLKDLLLEVEEAEAATTVEPVTPQQTTVLQQNFVRINMIQNEITRIFGKGNEPKTGFDDTGMFIVLDDTQLREYTYHNDKGVVFTLPEQPFDVDEKSNIKKFRIMFNVLKEPEEAPTEGDTAAGEGGETPPAA